MTLSKCAPAKKKGRSFYSPQRLHPHPRPDTVPHPALAVVVACLSPISPTMLWLPHPVPRSSLRCVMRPISSLTPTPPTQACCRCPAGQLRWVHAVSISEGVVAVYGVGAA
jgi:hypothetical protein